MDIGKSFTFLLDDERKLEKLGIGTAVVLISMLLSPVLIGVVGFFVLGGYCVRLLHNVREGAERPLPEWDRWGDDIAVGFKYFVIQLIYLLPVFLLLVPMIVGTAIASQGGSGEGVGFLFLMCGVCLTILYSLLFTVLQPGIMIAFARDEEIRSGLDIGLIWTWTRRNIGPVLIVTLVYLATSAVAGIVGPLLGVLLCVVGLVVTVPLGILLPYLIQAHMFGQLARDPFVGGDPFTIFTQPNEPTERVVAPVSVLEAEPLVSAAPTVDLFRPVESVDPIAIAAPVEFVEPVERAESIEIVALGAESPAETFGGPSAEPPVSIEPPVGIEPPAIVPPAPDDPAIAQPPLPEEPQNPA